MTRALSIRFIVLLLTCCSSATTRHSTEQLSRAESAPQPCDMSTLTAAKIDGTLFRSAALVSDGSFTPPPSGAALTNLPVFCRVEASVSAAKDSLINFEVWIPQDWNQKIVVTGNAGYGNALNYRDMAYAMSQGYAAVGGDTGHQSATSDDLLWGVGHPDRIIDWGTRSIHAIAGASRLIVQRARGTRPRRAYFYGCSTGGHQAYAEIQRYPRDFDGVIAGAPGNNRVRLNVGFLWQFLANHHPHDNAAPIIPASKLPLITKAVVAACDRNDGVSDGVIDDPRSCQFDPAVLACREGDNSDCLTNAQIAALQKMYAGPRNVRTGEQIYPGWPKGSEALTVSANGMPASGWQSYWGTTEPTRANFWRHWVFADPKWDWWSFDFDRDLARADRGVGRMVDQVQTRIDAFKNRGGKAIVYQGWQDPVVNALDTIAYYERVRARQGSQDTIDGFFRLFLVSGMGHCAGGTGTTNFGNQNGPAVVIDAQHDLLAALDLWVEKATPPARIVAARVQAGKTVRTRPLCPYPLQARYSGTGSTDDAENFVCR
jgi:feruloyl esterase